MIQAATPFCCPLCGGALAADASARALRCKKGHSFDCAREGYVHLLPANQMHAKIPGDNKEMVAARRSFLQAGFYAPFSDALNEIVCAELHAKHSRAAAGNVRQPLLVDAGCGEGYYTNRLAAALAQAAAQRDGADQTPGVAAFDISKFAVKAAAKQAAGPVPVSYAVASSFSVPLPTACADILINVFSPMAQAEFSRVLKPGGLLVFAVPGPRHLFGLKEILYEQPYENPVQEIAYPGFACERRVPVHSEINVPQEQVNHLFTMTPYYWKTSKEGAARLLACESLHTQIHFDFVCYRRV